MGEAVYYMKADGCTEEIFERVKSFILEGSESEDWWQKHREYERGIKGDRNKFWKEFDSKFPLVTKYLKSINLHGQDCNNDLAGYLDFGYFDEDEPLDDYITFNKKTGKFKFHALVWHFADWNGFAKFLMSEFGLKNVRWISDEDVTSKDIFRTF